MDSDHATDHDKDSQNGSRRSSRSRKADPRLSSSRKHKRNFSEKIQDEEEKGNCEERRSKTRNWNSDPDKDQISDEEGRRGSGSYYSDDYENGSHSDRSLSPYTRSRTTSPTPKKGIRPKTSSASPPSKTGGMGHKGMIRPMCRGGRSLTQQQRKGARSQSKDSTPPRDLDLVTKRMLSGRLLKINELRNALAELQHRTDELQKENRTLKHLQFRQEKALQRYDDTESEISQLLTRHSSETHVLRERLRRTQDRERATERRLKYSEEQLQRSQATVMRLKKLVNQRELGAKEELSRRLEEEQARAEEAEHKVKELEHSIQLSNNSFQRYLAAEKKKTVNAQEEIKTLKEQLERLNNKIKEKEKELEAKNIYANRLLKPPLKKDTDGIVKQKEKLPSKNCSKAIQTDDRSSSLGFPTPPPALADAPDYHEQRPDEYLSLKELDGVNRPAESKVGHQNGEHQKMRKRSVDTHEEKMSSQRELWEKDTAISEETHHKKEQLLAKMHEIDRQSQGGQDSVFTESSDSSKSTSEHSSPRPQQQKNQHSSIFTLTSAEESTNLVPGDGSAERGRKRSGMGRKTLGTLSNEDLAFGSYAPSFGNSSPRGSSDLPPPPHKEERNSALEAIGVFSIRGVETEKEIYMKKEMAKDKKSNLIHQLFGAVATPAGDNSSTCNKLELLSSPSPANNVRSRGDGLMSFNAAPSPPPSSLNILHVAESRTAVRAIPSFDDEIEELRL
ncbi:lebercilin isoform X2 [Cynoglossus semilaevis]|uniref:Lebercilin LCA5 n=1 Tax=Cynoglossus semilaevis TaxID=244447 RepID=A0A3P8W8F0_CYNSE|nr:lebercilin-like isoform X2 [Cynoglossus semilaevis]